MGYDRERREYRPCGGCRCQEFVTELDPVEADPARSFPEAPDFSEELPSPGRLESAGSGRIYGGAAPYASNHRIDEYVRLDVAEILDPFLRSLREDRADEYDETGQPIAAPSDVVIDRWEIRNTVNTTSGDELVYRVRTMVFHPGGTLIVRARTGIKLFVTDLFIQSSTNPGAIQMQSPAAPAQRPVGANGTRGVDAPDYTYRGGDGGPGHFGLQGLPGEPCPYLYLIGTRCDNAYALSIIAVGGAGGAGSNGGDGGNGGSGHRGRDGHGDAFNCYRGCTNGTRGGTGGQGGYPHYGGSGGYGGTVWLQGPRTFLDRARAFRINNEGGAGGRRGRPGVGGLGGHGAFAGRSPGICGSCSDGRSGFVGVPGPVGNVSNGARGPTGTIRHIET